MTAESTLREVVKGILEKGDRDYYTHLTIDPDSEAKLRTLTEPKEWPTIPVAESTVRQAIINVGNFIKNPDNDAARFLAEQSVQVLKDHLPENIK